MKSKFEQDKELEVREALVAAQTAAFERFLTSKRPDVNFGVALLKAVQEYMLDSFLTATDEDFEYALENMTTGYSSQRVETLEELKIQLIDKIVERLTATNNKHWSIDHNVKTERAKLQFSTVEQLTARLNDIVRSQKINSLPVAEIRQMAQANRDYTGFPILPKQIVPPGKVRAQVLDANYLKALDSWELKKFLRLYGGQVNDRLAGRS